MTAVAAAAASALLFVCAPPSCLAQEEAPAVQPPPAAAKPADAQPQKGQGKARKSMRDLIDPGGEMPSLPPPGPGDPPNYGFMKKALEQCLTDEEKASLKKLAFENPDEFREEMHKRFQSMHQKRQEESRKSSELLKAYREAASPEAKQQALDKIKALVKEQFAQKMELNKKRLDETERNLQEASKRLEDFKRKYEDRKAKADQIVDERVKDLLKDPNLEW